MIFGVDRWFSDDSSQCYFFVDEYDTSALTVTLFKQDNGELIADSFNLTHVGYCLYVCDTPDSDYTDSFELYDGGQLLVSFKPDNFDKNKDFFTKNGNSSIKKAPFESNNGNVKAYKFWDANRVGYKARKFNLSTYILNIVNGLSYDVIVDDGNSFIGFGTPQEIDRDSFNKKLEDAVTLYESDDNGRVFIITKEGDSDVNRIVIPFSNHSATWSEEYAFDDFYTLGNFNNRFTLRLIADDKIHVTSSQTIEIDDIFYEKFSDGEKVAQTYSMVYNSRSLDEIERKVGSDYSADSIQSGGRQTEGFQKWVTYLTNRSIDSSGQQVINGYLTTIYDTYGYSNGGLTFINYDLPGTAF